MKLNRFIEHINEYSDLAVGSVGKKKFRIKGYRSWDEARPQGVVEADSQESIMKNFSSFIEVLKKQNVEFEGADLESVEEIPNNI